MKFYTKEMVIKDLMDLGFNAVDSLKVNGMSGGVYVSNSMDFEISITVVKRSQSEATGLANSISLCMDKLGYSTRILSDCVFVRREIPEPEIHYADLLECLACAISYPTACAILRDIFITRREMVPESMKFLDAIEKALTETGHYIVNHKTPKIKHE